jgi:hypothetical protein
LLLKVDTSMTYFMYPCSRILNGVGMILGHSDMAFALQAQPKIAFLNRKVATNMGMSCPIATRSSYIQDMGYLQGPPNFQ